MSGLDAAERLKQDVGSLLEAGRTVAREYGHVGGSFRRLVLSDISLARVALVRGLVFLMLCALMAGTGWVVAMTMLVVGLHQSGLSWLLALLVPLVLSLLIARYAWIAARKALAFADLDATRRQLAAWFTPTQPISTESPTGDINPGPPDPEGKTEEVAPKAPV
ncbi:MAG: hypothetical protein WC213_02080 [Arenimonas sp.]|jgi:hypothetical protein